MGRIQLEQLTKRFGETVAVDDVTFDIEDSEFLVLVGPSGCGKSTTLRMLAGLETPTSGELYIAGEHMNYRVPQNRDIAMVFQDYALYPHMTIRENIRFGLEEEPGYTPDERDERVEEVAETLGIDDLLDRKPGELSGGQQQRVALGRAIVRDPEVFLMDEPLANLDAKLRTQMRTELQRLQEDLDVTTVYVTHNQTEAMTMGDRIAVLNDGRLQQVGEPLELYHAPENQFVAGFIGEPMMNFLHGSRSEKGFAGEYIEYPFDERLEQAVGDTDDLVLGIRPEAIDVRHAGESALESLGPHEFRMTVTVTETHGDQNVVTLTHAEDEASHDAIRAVTDGMHIVNAGESVIVTIEPDAVHVFDGETGEVLRNRRLETARELTI
ncbi:ABC transporter related protein (plasmid) [Haloterrigena turkmenica DSM 5511]|uniref:ABC-type D-xylose/L-arabinose transporter n=1 Tax=Haloterrigena turkmenica (strain ATCC 51198 / DSM 5511 / JCM 9101 / NCIMB 13204 / VKM B-1734 / 4k) TaxID=543526 RepID=D2S1R3_HALTV|nr:ABC transporter ATP-binding protein [Haloterrigena turkmenica]ADB63310.1 ABC transporter related protein [Haloterrigena turkmenica DSM 5511]